MADLAESGSSIYRRRRRRRASITLTIVSSLLVGTLVYAGLYFQGLANASKPVAGACHQVTSKKVLTPSGVLVNVYNTTAHTGLASAVANALRKQGFKVASVANDPLGQSIQGSGQIRHGPTGTNAATLARTRLPGSIVVLDDRPDASVDIVLGNEFTALRAPPRSPRAITVRSTTTC